MTIRLRASLIMIGALAMISLAGCDHYNCASGANFGSGCTSEWIWDWYHRHHRHNKRHGFGVRFRRGFHRYD